MTLAKLKCIKWTVRYTQSNWQVCCNWREYLQVTADRSWSHVIRRYFPNIVFRFKNKVRSHAINSCRLTSEHSPTRQTECIWQPLLYISTSEAWVILPDGLYCSYGLWDPTEKAEARALSRLKLLSAGELKAAFTPTRNSFKPLRCAINLHTPVHCACTCPLNLSESLSVAATFWDLRLVDYDFSRLERPMPPQYAFSLWWNIRLFWNLPAPVVPNAISDSFQFLVTPFNIFPSHSIIKGSILRNTFSLGFPKRLIHFFLGLFRLSNDQCRRLTAH